MSRHTTFQPISVRHTPLWQRRTPPISAPTNQHSPHAVLAMPNSAICVPTNQRALRAAQLRCPLPFRPKACAAARDKALEVFRGSCQFQEPSSVILSWIFASVTSTRLISVTDHRAFRVAARVPAPGAPRAPRYPFAPQDQPCDARVLPLPRVHPLPRALPHLQRTSPSPSRAALAVAFEHRSAYPGFVPQGTKRILLQGTGSTRGVGPRDHATLPIPIKALRRPRAGQSGPGIPPWGGSRRSRTSSSA